LGFKVSVIYEVGPFRLDPGAGVLMHKGIASSLGGRGVAVLSFLVEHANEFVSKASIISAAWPDVVVEENNLAAQISAIRHVLAKVPGGEHWVETLARRGYRFVGPVVRLPDNLAVDAAADAPRSNLPEPLTSFVGRERELVEIKRLLPRKRLLTLVGMGGIGKTRLALQVAAEVVDAYRDGVWLVELAAINDASLVPGSVAQVLGVLEKAGTPQTDTLCAYLKSRQLLLILDNCEHLLGSCATLAGAMLHSAPQLTIIATTREPLSVAGEQIYPLASLSLPDLKASIEAIGSAEAVQLFVERAQQQHLGFALTADRAVAVAQLCVQLDGIPLALELAAARVRSLTIEEIKGRLNNRFNLLTEGARTALPRQQTLRATLDWSYELLREDEKALLAKLSVFSGSWLSKAARQVCMREGIHDWEALDLVTALAEKNLVVAEEHGAITRYRLLDTVREYARERLGDSNESRLYHDRHLSYFLALAEAADPELRRADQQAWMDCLEVEHDNLRAALSWSAGPGERVPEALRLAGALSRFWFVRGYYDEGRRWLAGLLAVDPLRQSAPARAKALYGIGALARLQGDHVNAERLHEEALGLRRELGDRQGIAISLNDLGLIAREQGRHEVARERLRESHEIFEQLGDLNGIESTLNNLALLAKDQGDYAAARELLEKSLVVSRQRSNRWGTAVCLVNLGNVASELGDLAGARACYEQGLALGRELGDRLIVAASLNNLGDVACAQGDYAQATTMHAESLAIRRELGARQGFADSLEGFANIAYGERKFDRAASIWGAVDELRKVIGIPAIPSRRAMNDRQIATARAALGDAIFDRAWQDGRAMTLEHAIEYALDDKGA
jgi:non-specific serine/threonine protein kinase